MSERLGAADFPAFYETVHGHAPFPWQHALVADVLASGRWPSLVDVPTGLGKTSMLDVAVFVAAATAHLPGAHRLGRRRCFFVVDRRIVVDEAYDHARRIAAAARDAEGRGDIAGRVAAGLRSLAPKAAGELLPVTRMRGGTTWASAWLDRPDRPGIVLGTVDQVGSRLLFRGYGVGDRRRPIDAALVGTDSLLLVDEAHLATALLTTVSAAQDRDRLAVPLPGLSVVQLSATGTPTANTFALDEAVHRSHALAGRRLTAGKRLTIRTATPKTCVKTLADAVVEHLDVLHTERRQFAPTALVVCNTVDRARAVHTLLQKALPDAEGCDLLIGRTRLIDRQAVQERVLTRFGNGRPPADRAAVLVATQTVEVGVNLDVDVLVTESASWDALVQRLGRVNRLGEFASRFPGRTAAPAVVVHDGAESPVYGPARDATWEILETLATEAVVQGDDGLDVSPLACRALSESGVPLAECTRQPNDVPVLLRPTLDAWVQTAPVPLADPPVAPFLHGFDSGAAPVQVVWREGLVSSDPWDVFDDGDTEIDEARADGLLTQWPPRTAEAVEVPFTAVRQWLNGETPDPVTDLEAVPDAAPRPPGRDPFRALVRRPATRVVDAPMVWRWIEAAAFRPGDQIVVPAERGGLDGYGWSPTDRASVLDVSEAATFGPSRSRRHAALRLDEGLPVRLGLDGAEALRVQARIADLCDTAEASPAPAALAEFGRVVDALLPADPAPSWTPEMWSALRRWLTDERLELVEVRDPAERQIDGARVAPWARALTGARPSTPEPADDLPLPDRDDDEVAASSVGPTSGRVTLDVHHGAVRARAGEIATALVLPDDLRAVVQDAAGWHDLGKVEPRFQVMLHGGDPYEAALATEVLAKSGMDPADRLAWRRAAQRSGLPGGARHEAWSAALVEELVRDGYPGDVDLLIHLVASHHGYARPLARLVVDSNPTEVMALVDGEKVTVSSERTVSLEHPARFARLNERYGRWGLALLETIVRCADTTVSAEGS